MRQAQEQQEQEQRLVEALDRFHEGHETEDDLNIICYFTGLNYRPQPRNSHGHERSVSQQVFESF